MIPLARLVPFPPRGRKLRRYLKKEGQLVEYNSWWQRREAQGDCKQGPIPPPEETPEETPEPPSKPARKSRAKTKHEVG